MELPSSSVDNLFVSSMRVTRMSWYLCAQSRTCCGTGILATLDKESPKKTIGRRGHELVAYQSGPTSTNNASDTPT